MFNLKLIIMKRLFILLLLSLFAYISYGQWDVYALTMIDSRSFEVIEHETYVETQVLEAVQFKNSIKMFFAGTAVADLHKEITDEVELSMYLFQDSYIEPDEVLYCLRSLVREDIKDELVLKASVPCTFTGTGFPGYYHHIRIESAQESIFVVNAGDFLMLMWSQDAVE